jgi:leader peptidase (prepilin peptidase)/N-methyltransferase
MAALFTIVFGLLIGSFLNVVVYRFPKGESIVTPASHCTSCGHKLKPWENIPLFSYLFLRGACSSCKSPIAARYPLVEGLTGVIFYSAYSAYGLSWDLVVFALFGALLLAIAFIDIDHLIIPDSMLLIGLLPGFYLLFAKGAENLVYQLLGFSGLGLAFWIIRFVGAKVYKREAMGLGDVKFAAMAGWVQGWDVGIVSMFLAFLSATLLMTVLMPLGIIDRKQKVPFGPFICLGIWLGQLWGREIIDWYLSLFMGF